MPGIFGGGHRCSEWDGGCAYRCVSTLTSIAVDAAADWLSDKHSHYITLCYCKMYRLYMALPSSHHIFIGNFTQAYRVVLSVTNQGWAQALVAVVPLFILVRQHFWEDIVTVHDLSTNCLSRVPLPVYIDHSHPRLLLVYQRRQDPVMHVSTDHGHDCGKTRRKGRDKGKEWEKGRMKGGVRGVSQQPWGPIWLYLCNSLGDSSNGIRCCK